MLSRLQCTFCLNRNNVNDYIKPCMRQSLKCMHGIVLRPGITLALATPLFFLSDKMSIASTSVTSLLLKISFIWLLDVDLAAS